MLISLARASTRRARTHAAIVARNTRASSALAEMNARGDYAGVIASYESGRVRATERDTAEYLRALVHANRVNESALAAAVH